MDGMLAYFTVDPRGNNENGTCKVEREDMEGTVARHYTVFCVKLCHESVLLLHPKTVHESSIL